MGCRREVVEQAGAAEDERQTDVVSSVVSSCRFTQSRMLACFIAVRAPKPPGSTMMSGAGQSSME
jgi:hypothetical protein